MKIEKIIKLAKERSERDWLLVSLLAEYGLKTGEVSSLKPEHVKEGTLRVGKRTIKLEEEHAKMLSASEGSYIFKGRNGKNLTPRQIQNIVRICSKLAIGEELTPNHLRRFFARRFIQQGGDIKRLRRLLGHAHLHTTKRLIG